MVVVHDEEMTVPEPRLEQGLAFHQDLVVLRRALDALEEAHHDADCDREAQIVGQQQMDSGY